MKIVRLDLRAFGPFTDVTLDLAAGREGLHVIYGPNEAGKSTALRAIEQALFGIPSQTGDDFIHPYKSLRIGATLAARDGSELSFLRRKTLLNSLLAADNVTSLPEGALRPFLGDLDREQFRVMFGIDHRQLVQGGEEIVGGGGSVGQLLFAAGSGIADLQSVQQRLQSEADDLFRPKAQKNSINKLLKEFDEARKKAKRLQLPGEQWHEHHAALAGAQQRRQGVEKELQDLRQQQHRWERLSRALPLLAQRRQWRARRCELGEVVLLPAAFAPQRREAQLQRESLRKSLGGLEDEIHRTDEQLAAIELPESLLAHARAIKELPNAMGSYRKAQRDLPELKGKKEQSEREALRILRQIRPEASLEIIDGLQLTTPQQVAIRDLGNRYGALLQALKQSREEMEQITVQLGEEETQLQALGETPDAGALRELLQRVQKEGDLEAAAEETRAKLARARQQAAAELARLPHWSGTLAELELLKVPSGETVDRLEQELAESQRQAGTAQERQQNVAAELADVERQIDQSHREGELPSEEDLLAARRIRDRLWLLFRSQSAGEHKNSEGAEELLEQFPLAADVPTAYEAAVEKADACADRLRREAARVANLAALLAEREALLRQGSALAEQLQALRGRQEAVEAAWRQCWNSLGVEPVRPREMRAWLQAYQSLLQQAQAVGGHQQALDQLQQRATVLGAQLQHALQELGSPGDPAAASLAELVARGQAVVDQLQGAVIRREQLVRSVRQLRQRHELARQRAQGAEAELRAWRESWTVAMQPLGLNEQTTPAAANAVLGQIADVLAAGRDAGDKAERIEGIHAEADVFGGQVGQLVQVVAIDLAERPAEQAAEMLVGRLEKAMVDQQQRQTLDQQRSRLVRQRQEILDSVETLTTRLELMCREAHCGKVEELPQAEQAAETAAKLDEQLASLETQLFALAAGASLETLSGEAEAVSADEIPGRIEQIARQIEQLEQTLRALNETVGSEQAQLAAMQSEEGAAEAAEETQELLARLEGEVLQYVRLRLASAILRDGIESYRAKNEAPVMRRASELFAQLTRGSFQRLIVEVDGEGHKVLKGVRGETAGPPAGEKTVDLQGMSEGTADQLFLALRLASLESRLETQEPIPLVVDDILISFDDDRAAAALGALAQLAQKTQVLFFTHHRHLVELARVNVDGGQLFVHRLETN